MRLPRALRSECLGALGAASHSCDGALARAGLTDTDQEVAEEQHLPLYQARTGAIAGKTSGCECEHRLVQISRDDRARAEIVENQLGADASTALSFMELSLGLEHCTAPRQAAARQAGWPPLSLAAVMRSRSVLRSCEA